MGYYSEVGLALTQAGVKELHKRLDLEKENACLIQKVQELFDYADQHYSDAKSNAELWLWKGIRWYSCDPCYFPDVHFIEEFLASLDESDFRFIRIGENYDDTEVLGYFTENPFDFELAREMTFKPA